MEELISILSILKKYDFEVAAEHDIILFYNQSDDFTMISDEDAETLDWLNCFYSDEYDCLAYFV